MLPEDPDHSIIDRLTGQETDDSTPAPEAPADTAPSTQQGTPPAEDLDATPPADGSDTGPAEEPTNN